MTLRVDLLDGEEILYGEVYSPSKNVEPFALGVSNKAVFFAEKKRFAVRDPWILNRFSFGKILSVAIYREQPYVWWVLSTLLILVGLTTSLWMLIPGWGDSGATRSGFPLGVLVVGIVLPFVVRGRMILELNTVDRTLRWKPPITVNSTPRRKASAMQHAFVNACREVGIMVKDIAA